MCVIGGIVRGVAEFLWLGGPPPHPTSPPLSLLSFPPPFLTEHILKLRTHAGLLPFLVDVVQLSVRPRKRTEVLEWLSALKKNWM